MRKITNRKIIMATEKFRAKGMHCRRCERRIEQTIRDIEGIRRIKADYTSETVLVEFDPNKTNTNEISKAVERGGYDCSLIKEKNSNYYHADVKLLGIAFGIIGILVVAYFISRFIKGIPIPEIGPGVGYGLLFVVGLLTGFHCISMCGGFVVGYASKHAQEGTKSYKSHLMYGLGKTVSYTLVGATFGLLGAIVAFTPAMRGSAGIIAGLFLILFGLKMFNIFPVLRKLQLRTPAFISKFVDKKQRGHSSPLFIGLLNGLMIACGPLQAIYIMAAGTGSMLEGAKLLFVFALGTLPVMLGFGYFTSLISSKATYKILKASGVIVLVLGLLMINRGLALTGTGLDAKSVFASVSAISDKEKVDVQDSYQVIKMEANRYGWNPDRFVLKKGVPVKWVINGKEINGCNSAIEVPELGLTFNIKPGEQIIEFTPEKEGTISWSCWMGMLQGVFIVKGDKGNIDLSDTEQIQRDLAAVPKLEGGSCNSAGGCGCGGRR